MGKMVKPVLFTCSLAFLGGAVLLPACRSSSEKSEEKANLGKKTKIEKDIEAFNQTQQDLIEANNRGASGCEKLDIMWNQIVATQQDEATMLPAKSNFAEVVAFGNGSAARFWRIFEGWSAGEGGSEIRPYEEGLNKKYVRLTHRFGTVAKMKFVVNAEAVKKLGYTGQYAEGNDCVLGRLSSAVPTTVEERFTPAVATKFFTDGPNESQVLIVQHDIGGQSSGTDYTVNPPKEKGIDNNFYTKYLSNRLSFEKGVLSGVGAFSRFFYTAQWYSRNVLKLDYIFDPRELQASHLANRRPNGETVAKPKGPRFVWMSAPTPDMKAEFGAMAAKDLDFRKHFLSLNSRGSSLPVFNVYASDTWTYDPPKDATLIGQLITNSPFVVSEAADVRLFFKHAIQFHKIPETEGKPNPYTQDFPFAEWNDKLFTDECRLGVKAEEVTPKNLEDLNGSFIWDAALNPFKMRKNKEGKPCLVGIIEGKLEETAGPALEKKLP